MPPRRAADAPPSRLREVRLRRGITQEQLAALVGVNPRTIYTLEHGQVENPGIRLLVNLSKALAVDLPLICQVEWLRWTAFDPERAPREPTPKQLAELGYGPEANER